MRMPKRPISALIGLVLCLATSTAASTAEARQQSYDLDGSGSVVAFEVAFGSSPIRGSMPVESADLLLDFDRVAQSKVTVTLNAQGAKTSLPFAAQAMKAASVLDTARFPTMRFRSTTIRATKDGATMDGDLTLRGITHPLRLTATLFRQQGTAAGDKSRLTLHLTGSLQRSAYGATGWSDLVGDTVQIDIRARIHARN
jgi:polyisoprenoid-binding protein YceI